MSDSRDSAGTGLMFFLLGTAVGALVVALTTPKTGPELRADLRDLGGRVREKVGRAGNDIRYGLQEAAEEASKG